MQDLVNSDPRGRYITTPLTFKFSSEISHLISEIDYTSILLHNGDVFIWGDNTKSQLGLGDTENRSIPIQVTLPGLARILGIPKTWTLENNQDFPQEVQSVIQEFAMCWIYGLQMNLDNPFFTEVCTHLAK